MRNTSELARKYNLSRKTCSVTRDTKGGQVIIVEEVSDPKNSDGFCRSETYYRVFGTTPTEQINDLIAETKAAATLEFLGLHSEVSEEPAVAEPEAAPPQKGKAKGKPKAKTKAKPKDEEVKLVEDTDTNLFDEVDEADESAELAPAKPVLYDKASRDHVVHLKPLIVKKLGADWKEDKKKYAKVRALVTQLHGKVAVMTAEGDVLPTFGKFVEKYLS